MIQKPLHCLFKWGLEKEKKQKKRWEAKGGKGGFDGECKNKKPGRSGATRSPLVKCCACRIERMGKGFAGVWSGLPGMLQEDPLPHLRQPLIYLESCSPTANDQLKLDYFFPFVCRPAALAQLHICVDGTLKTTKVPDSFLSLLFSLRFFCLFLFLSSQLERFSVLVLSVSPCRFPLVKC